MINKLKELLGFTKKAALKTENAASASAEKVEGVIDSLESGIFAKIKEFMKYEASGGIVLMIAAAVAVIIANTPLFPFYEYVLDNIKFRIGFTDASQSFDIGIQKSLRLWINDGLMVIFFFLIGLEIKHEMIQGELSNPKRLVLPAFGAIGGIVAPALIFWYVNSDVPANLDGWAIPTATDIAFALGVASLLGSRVPTSLKVLLTTIAVLDDITAICIIAIFYTDHIQFLPMYYALAALVGLIILNLRGVANTAPYILLTIILWIAVLKSGVHATLAGVVAAMFIPMKDPKNPSHSPVQHLEHALHPWVAFGVLPIFALANAGVPLLQVGMDDIVDKLSLGITLGLILGKPIGIFGLMWLAIALRLSPKPEGASWVQIFAISVLCGVGFTMSLFIGGLAFTDLDQMASVRFGVLLASVIAAVLGYMLLKLGKRTDLTPSQLQELKMMEKAKRGK